jgi:NNP family nitrate/nitrite transporter-like MFS transporter
MRVAGGFVSDRLGGERVLLVSLLIMLAGSVIMVISKNFATVVTAELVLAVGMGVGNAAVFKLVPKFAPTTVGGTAGIVGGLGALGGFIIPLTLGGIIGYGTLNYTTVFLVFTLLSVASLLIFKTLRSHVQFPSFACPEQGRRVRRG